MPAASTLTSSAAEHRHFSHCDLQREEDSSRVEELRLQLAQKEKELRVMKEGAEELNSLRQQNFVLQSKVHKHTHNTGQNKIFIPYHLTPL